MFARIRWFLLLAVFLLTPLQAAEKHWVTVDLNGQGDFDSIQAALASGQKYITLRNGNYPAYTTIRIAHKGIELRGESKKGVVIEAKNCIDLLHVDADDVTVSNLTLKHQPHCKNTTFVTSDHDSITLKNSILYGSDHMFTVYFAGKKHTVGQQPLNMLEKSDLNTGNRVLNNTIYSKYAGDVLSFSLQTDGLVEGNTLYGGMISLFLDRFVQCKNNMLIGPVKQGIFVSLPSYDVTVSNNHISGSKASAIKVANQIDHTDKHGRSLTTVSHRSSGIMIMKNHIEGSRFHGIEIQNLTESLITDNVVKDTDFSGIYVLRSNNIGIHSNRVIDATQVDAGVRNPIHAWGTSWDAGIYLEQYVADSAVHKNTVITEEGRIRRGIAINPYWSGNEENSIHNNELIGNFRYEPVHFGSDSTSVKNNKVKSTP